MIFMELCKIFLSSCRKLTSNGIDDVKDSPPRPNADDDDPTKTSSSLAEPLNRDEEAFVRSESLLSSSSSPSIGTTRAGSWCSDDLCLLNVGDSLFLLGSLVDMVTGIVSFAPIGNVGAISLAASGLVSSVVWLVDAILYMVANAVKEEVDEGEESIVFRPRRDARTL